MRLVFWLAALLALVGLAGWLTAPVPDLAPAGDPGSAPAARGDRRQPAASLPVGRIAPLPGPPVATNDQPRATVRPSAPDALPGRLVIAVRDALDLPVAGVRVMLRPGTPMRRAGVTGGDGEVDFDRLTAGRYAYRLEAPDQRPARAAGALELAPGEMRRLELQLPAHDRAIAGRVLDRQGAPVAGLIVEARLYRPARSATLLVPRSQADQRSETGAGGGFEIVGLQDAEYRVRTVADDLYDAATAVVRAGADEVLLSVARRRELRVHGQVTDAAGLPLAGASVIAGGAPARRARTDREGRYELVIAGSAAGRERITFRAEGHLPKRFEVAAAPPGETAERHLDATLPKIENTVAVTARLLDDRGEPVTGERLYLYSRDLATHYQATSGADGAALFPAVAAGSDYELRISPQGPYEPYARRPLDLDDDTAGLEVVLRQLALARPSGRMVDATGAPVTGFGLRVARVDAPGRSRQVQSDAEGYFEVDEVPEGELILQSASMPRLSVDGIVVDHAADAYAEVVLDWGMATLDGRVVDAAGAAVPGARVDLYWQHERAGIASRALRSTVTDDAGRFGFSRLGPAGARRLMVSAAGLAPAERTVAPGRSSIEVPLHPVAGDPAR